MTTLVENDNRKIPIVIGVTGHRDIPESDLPKLREAVRGVLRDLVKAFPDSPFTILSSLAQGSDQLVAEVARELGFSLIVPLPLALSDYEKDFVDPAELDRFRALFADREIAFEIPDSDCVGADYQSETARARRYALAGAYVVRHSSILIALWDGIESQLEGGTADVIRYRLEGIPAGLEADWNPMQFQENGIVYLIKTPRLRHTAPLPDAFSVKTVCASERVRQACMAELFRINDFNRLSGDLNSPKAEEDQSSTRSLCDELHCEASHGNELGREALDSAQLKSQWEKLDRLFHMADSLALSAQRSSKHSLIVILICAFAAALGVNELSESPSLALFVLCVCAFGLAYGVYFSNITRGRAQTRHQDFRALAESLRVQFYWSLAGVGDRAARFFLQSAADDSTWIRSALRFSASSLPITARVASRERYESVLNHWIVGQRHYFQNSFRDQLATTMRLSSVKFALLVTAGVFKILPDVITWIGADPSIRTIWFVVGQGLVAAMLVGFHINSRIKDLRSQRRVFELLDEIPADVQAPRIGFWSRPIGLVVIVLIAVGAGAVILRQVTIGGVSDPVAVASLCNVIFLSAASAAAMIHVYGHVHAFSDHLRQYGRMFSLFAHAERIFRSALNAGNLPEARKVIFSLGREALEEAAQWLRLHKGRPIEVPRF